MRLYSGGQGPAFCSGNTDGDIKGTTETSRTLPTFIRSRISRRSLNRRLRAASIAPVEGIVHQQTRRNRHSSNRLRCQLTQPRAMESGVCSTMGETKCGHGSAFLQKRTQALGSCAQMPRVCNQSSDLSESRCNFDKIVVNSTVLMVNMHLFHEHLRLTNELLTMDTLHTPPNREKSSN